MKSLFILTSSINFNPSKALDYNPVRSLFPPKERFQQTARTLSSIREYSPESDILISDNTKLTPDQQEFFKKECDHTIFGYHDFGVDERMVQFLRDYPNKSHSVCQMLLEALFFTVNHISTKYDLYFIMSGRYRLTNRFDKQSFSLEKICCKKHDGFGYGMYTTLYSFPHKLFDYFITSLLWAFSVTSNALPPHVGYSLETNLLSHDVDANNLEKLKFLDSLGIEGNLGPCGRLHSE